MTEVVSDGWKGCGCKGIRSCLLCESGGKTVTAGDHEGFNKKLQFFYSSLEGIAKGIDGCWFHFPGVHLIKDFVTEDEEQRLVQFMDQGEWRHSQSGRRKQDFGPKVNFKKQKLRVGNFSGLPNISQVLWERMKQHAVLEGFLPVEQCNLDYHSERGSAIDPHFDDSWLWGERLVSLNLLSDTVLTMTSDDVSSLQLMPVLQKGAELNMTGSDNNASDVNIGQNPVSNNSQAKQVPCSNVEVAICLPRRSLVVLYGDARYKWKHAIHREHIKHRRVCSTFRELSVEFSLGGKEEKLGEMLLKIALGFQGKAI
uniref:MGC83815 protein n=1 Tax=Xenopus laevis TaxID=8355 RepID=Q6NRH2_XENLA|nr:MGC83815 protein [Xenopus laevis]